MRHRISAGVLCERDDRILLLHNLKLDVCDFWVAPGGGAEGVEDLYATAQRETFEECGLVVKPLKLAYIEELIWADSSTRQCKFWFTACVTGGEINLNKNPSIGENIVGVSWVSQEEMRSRNVFPPVLRSEYWQDKLAGFGTPKYLGVRQMTFV
jgi:8-oxo-dGTP diphosphatase